MNTPWQQDQELHFPLPFSKIISIVPLAEDQLLVLHHNYEFAVLRLAVPECELLAMGSLPHLSCHISMYSKTQIIFLQDNAIFIFDWLESEITATLRLPASEIYN